MNHLKNTVAKTQQYYNDITENYKTATQKCPASAADKIPVSNKIKPGLGMQKTKSRLHLSEVVVFCLRNHPGSRANLQLLPPLTEDR
ncbi:MAG: hypothetical protein GX902_05535 [Lentisphaerae bacterium]|nr:hypothetical protein [Lentisphaerota bacterium]